MTAVLVVEDDPLLRRTLSINLRGRGFEVITASTGHDALAEVERRSPDLVVLDLGLPDMDGQYVLARLRQTGHTLPVLVLSARHSSAEKVAALEHGGDDYVTKPFDVPELVARLHVLMRHHAETESASRVYLGPVTVDLTARLVTRAAADGPSDGAVDAVVRLTPTEWRMLEALLRRPGILVAANELLVAMRGTPVHTERSYLRIYVQQLRRKLEADPAHPRYLLTEAGMGYRFQP